MPWTQQVDPLLLLLHQEHGTGMLQRGPEKKLDAALTVALELQKLRRVGLGLGRLALCKRETMSRRDRSGTGFKSKQHSLVVSIGDLKIAPLGSVH